MNTDRSQTRGPLGGLLAIGTALSAYTLIEPYRMRLASKTVPLDLPGRAETEIHLLHISDTHLGAGQRTRRAFLASLPERLERTPDLIVSTGDLIESDAGIEPLLDAYAPLEAGWGRFYVNGSHDYYQARFQSYAKYLDGVQRRVPVPADTERLEGGLEKLGWVALTNREELIDTPIGRIRLAGVDDPYLNRHSTSHLRTKPDDALRIGVMHAPDVVSEFALAGFDVMLAGHTHGGQVRFPLIGAVISNCALPPELAMGLQRVGSSWLHVSPGLGHGTYSPIRFMARPEVTLLKIRAQP